MSSWKSFCTGTDECGRFKRDFNIDPQKHVIDVAEVNKGLLHLQTQMQQVFSAFLPEKSYKEE